ncbi:MAG: hypothetical protein VCD00_14670, partial [Candidatus Hydrogenedentota bacterium]
MNRMLYSLLALLTWTACSTAQPPMQTHYETAREHYDIEMAIATRDSLSEQKMSNTILYAEVCLLIAELYRIDYEDTPNDEGGKRRSLGKEIDEATDKGLSSLAELEDSSERYRVKADLIGCKMRTKFKARKYRHTMD